MPEKAEMPYSGEEELPQAPTHVEEVRARHERDLLAIPGVKGIGVGEGPLGEPVIVVYVGDASTAKRVPRKVEDVEVESVVTGEIDAL